jgi:hypothetical protein
MNPLSHELNKLKTGYKIYKYSNPLNHLLYMDDIKLFTASANSLKQLIQSVQNLSADIRMSFGIDKCATLIMKRGKQVSAENIPLVTDEQIQTIDQDNSFKYLGVFENKKFLEAQMKSKITSEYKRRVKQILQSHLTAKNQIEAINLYAIPVLTYSFGTIFWTRAELQSIDRKTRKLFTINHSLHPKSCIERIYLSRKDGGRGLLQIESLHDRTLV